LFIEALQIAREAETHTNTFNTTASVGHLTEIHIKGRMDKVTNVMHGDAVVVIASINSSNAQRILRVTESRYFPPKS
jgi:4-hydroxy-3-methylbut-2-enyl diphosphate reductase IspH